MSGLSPTLGGFQEFITTIMQPPSYFDVTQGVVTYSFDFALQFVYDAINCVQGLPGAWSMYSMAVYNLAADTLIQFAQDQPNDPIYQNGMKYWAYLRKEYGILNFTPGLIQSASDESTSAGYMIPDTFKYYTLANLQNLKTPYGRQYLSIAGQWGTIWGLS